MNSTKIMTTMTIEKITDLQKKYDLHWIQASIDDGSVWKMEGKAGRDVIAHLEIGSCYLPEKRYKDYWKNIVPSRNDLKPGTTGTLENAQRFWQQTEDEESTDE